MPHRRPAAAGRGASERRSAAMRIIRIAVTLVAAVGIVLTVGVTGTASASDNQAVHTYREIDIGTLAGGPSSYPTAVNDFGDVVGNSQLPDSRYSHAFRWHQGDLTDLGVLNPDLPVS